MPRPVAGRVRRPGAGVAALLLVVTAAVVIGDLWSPAGPGGVPDLTGVAWQVTLPRPAEPAPSAPVAALDPVTGAPRWRTPHVDPRSSPWPRPALTASRVLAATLGGPLTAVDAADGGVAWRFAPDGGVHTAPAVGTVRPAPNPSAGAPRVYLGTVDEVVALDVDRGRVRWRTRLRPDRGGRPVATPSRVVFTEPRGVFAVSAEDGSFAWRSFPRGGGVPGGPVAHDHRLYVGATDGTLSAIESSTGRRGWVLDAGGRLVGSAALQAGVVVVRDAAGDLRAFEADSGRSRWRHDGDAGDAHRPAAGHGDRFFLTDGPDVLALDASSGATAWRAPVATTAAHVTAPAAGADTVYVATSEGEVVALEAASGRERWRYDTDAPIVATPAVGDGLVVVVTADGVLIALH